MSNDNTVCTGCQKPTQHGALTPDGWVALCPECAYAVGSPPELSREEQKEMNEWLALNVDS
jgi:hypothetical protein